MRSRGLHDGKINKWDRFVVTLYLLWEVWFERCTLSWRWTDVYCLKRQVPTSSSQRELPPVLLRTILSHKRDTWCYHKRISLTGKQYQLLNTWYVREWKGVHHTIYTYCFLWYALLVGSNLVQQGLHSSNSKQNLQQMKHFSCPHDDGQTVVQ